MLEEGEEESGLELSWRCAPPHQHKFPFCCCWWFGGCRRAAEKGFGDFCSAAATSGSENKRTLDALGNFSNYNSIPTGFYFIFFRSSCRISFLWKIGSLDDGLIFYF